MALSQHSKKQADQFFEDISLLRKAYCFNIFSYFAVKHEDKFILCQGRLFLNSEPLNISIPNFKSENLRAGYFDLTLLNLTPESLLEKLASGEIDTPDGALIFPCREHDQHDTFYQPFHQDGLQLQNRLNLLTIMGSLQSTFISLPEADWELKAAPTPYESVHELLMEFGLGSIRENFIQVEFIAKNIAAVSAQHSEVFGIKATPAVLVAEGISSKEVLLGYRILDDGQTIERSAVNGNEMHWGKVDNFQLGTCEINIPEGATVHCFVSCFGIAQHHYWLADPANSPNPKRTVHTIFDPDFEVIRDFLGRKEVKGQNARDFEIGVSWLLWMLGFSVTTLGITNRTRDAVDIVAATPNGHLAIVECTTGLLKADNKLPLLVARAEAISAGLKASGHGHLRILPIIITSKTRDEVRADLEQAVKLGVLVLSRENLDEALNMTLIPRDAEALYDEAYKNMISAQNVKNEKNPEI